MAGEDKINRPANNAIRRNCIPFSRGVLALLGVLGIIFPLLTLNIVLIKRLFIASAAADEKIKKTSLVLRGAPVMASRTRDRAMSLLEGDEELVLPIRKLQKVHRLFGDYLFKN
jgi:hypothetical protein